MVAISLPKCNFDIVENLVSHFSQLRVVHKLTTKLKREVILGSSSLDDPPQFITVRMFWLAWKLECPYLFYSLVFHKSACIFLCQEIIQRICLWCLPNVQHFSNFWLRWNQMDKYMILQMFSLFISFSGLLLAHMNVPFSGHHSDDSSLMSSKCPIFL